MTDRAGLRGNLISDPLHGLATAEVTSKVGGETEFFDYLEASGEIRSNRSSNFLYSNLSYLILGMVIEAASVQEYADFCQQSVQRPIGITDAVIPAEWTIVGPFGGWRMTLADVLKLRETFDLYHPSILDRRTLERTILGKLGGSIDKSGQLYYTVATWIRSNQSDGSYTIFHDGISRYYWGATPEFMYTESTFPGYAWVIAMVPEPSLSERRSILEETRNILRETVDEHQF